MNNDLWWITLKIMKHCQKNCKKILLHSTWLLNKFLKFAFLTELEATCHCFKFMMSLRDYFWAFSTNGFINLDFKDWDKNLQNNKTCVNFTSTTSNEFWQNGLLNYTFCHSGYFCKFNFTNYLYTHVLIWIKLKKVICCSF